MALEVGTTLEFPLSLDHAGRKDWHKYGRQVQKVQKKVYDLPVLACQVESWLRLGRPKLN